MHLECSDGLSRLKSLIAFIYLTDETLKKITITVHIFHRVYRMLTDKQHDFLVDKSTTNNIFCITQFISLSTDRHAHVDRYTNIQMLKSIR